MPSHARLNRRSVLKGVAGTALVLPVLEAMGDEANARPPRRFCALYTANGMSLPKSEHGLNDWSWFPTLKGNAFEHGKSTAPLLPFRRDLSFLGGLYHENGTKADPHVCSDMWLTGAPLHNSERGKYNSVGLDQVVAHHTKQYCRQPHSCCRLTRVWAFCRVLGRFPTASMADRFRRKIIRGGSLTDCSGRTVRL